MNHNPCIFTGALVKIEEYPAYIRCDVFKVGDSIIFTGFDRLVHAAELKTPDVENDEPPSEKVDAFITIWYGLLKEPQNFIVMPKDQVIWSRKGWERVTSNLDLDEATY